jgi:hypothetical protein
MKMVMTLINEEKVGRKLICDKGLLLGVVAKYNCYSAITDSNK